MTVMMEMLGRTGRIYCLLFWTFVSAFMYCGCVLEIKSNSFREPSHLAIIVE